MLFFGKVVGGDYMDSDVTTNQKGDLVVQQAETVGLIFSKDRKLNIEEVVAWDEVAADPRARSTLAGAVGEAVAGAALPGFVGKAASAAVGAGFDAANRARVVRIEWVGGKRSLIKLPAKLFTHLELLLEDRRTTPAAVAPAAVVPVAEAPLDPTGQVLTQVAGLIKDRRDASTPHPDPLDRIAELAQLRDRGILTDVEFAAKKAELLGRL